MQEFLACHDADTSTDANVVPCDTSLLRPLGPVPEPESEPEPEPEPEPSVEEISFSRFDADSSGGLTAAEVTAGPRWAGTARAGTARQCRCCHPL